MTAAKSSHDSSDAAPARGGRFATTHWSCVVAAGDRAAPGARAALAALCQAYWYPVYVFVRRQGYPADTAQDLTQSFFADLLSRETLAAADRQRGRFTHSCWRR